MKKKYLLYLVLFLIIMPISVYGLNSFDNMVLLEVSLTNLIMPIFILIAFFVLCNNSLNVFKSFSKHSFSDIVNEYGYEEEELKTIIKDNYSSILEAFNNFDYDTLKKLCSSELYDAYYSQLKSLEYFKQQRRRDNVLINDINFTDISIEKTRLIIKAIFNVSYFDYFFDLDSKQIIKGNDCESINKKYEMTFVKENIDFDSISKCPECLENVRVNAKGECKNCNHKILNYDDWFVLNKKVSK